MFRVIFWFLVATGMAGFFWFNANSKRMTAGQNLLFWNLIVEIVFVFLTSYGVFMFVHGARTGSVILAGKYNARAFSRESQPFAYWFVMALYVCWISLCLYLVCGCTLDLFKNYDVA
jgi:hypothetical protein